MSNSSQTPNEYRHTAGTLTVLGRGVRGVCALCGGRGVFKNFFEIKDECPTCKLHFERIEGHMIGAIAINTIISFGVLLATIVTSFVINWDNRTLSNILVPCIIVAVTFPVFFYRFSQTIWNAIDLIMRPLKETEASPGPWREEEPLDWRDQRKKTHR